MFRERLFEYQIQCSNRGAGLYPSHAGLLKLATGTLRAQPFAHL